MPVIEGNPNPIASILGGLIATYGGLQKGKHDRALEKQQQQQQANQYALEQQRLQLEQKRLQDEETRSGAPTLTPKQQMMPHATNSRGGITSAQETDPTKIGMHFMNLANIADQQGHTEAANSYRSIGQAYFQQAYHQSEIDRQEKHDTEMANLGQQRIDQAPQLIFDRTTGQLQVQSLRNQGNTNVANIRGANASALENQRFQHATAARYQTQANAGIQKMESENAIAMRTGKTLPYPDLPGFKSALSQAISIVARSPKELQAQVNQIRKLQSKGTMSPEMANFAIDQLQQAAIAGATGAPGGSNGTTPPPRPGP